MRITLWRASAPQISCFASLNAALPQGDLPPNVNQAAGRWVARRWLGLEPPWYCHLPGHSGKPKMHDNDDFCPMLAVPP